jgi:hypothetical protein
LYGRVLALVYLAAWSLTLVAVGLIAFGWTWAYAIFVPGALTMTVWAFDLNQRDPEAAERARRSGRFGMRPWQVTWYRVVLGVELPHAWRTFRRLGASSGRPVPFVPPKTR